MSKSNAAETAFLTLVYNNTDWAGIGDAGGLQNSAAAGQPVRRPPHRRPDGHRQRTTTSECAYAGPYARQAVPRSALGWTVSGNQVSNAALIQFPQCSGGSRDGAVRLDHHGRVGRDGHPLVRAALVRPRHLVGHPAPVRHRRAGHHGGLMGFASVGALANAPHDGGSAG